MCINFKNILAVGLSMGLAVGPLTSKSCEYLNVFAVGIDEFLDFLDCLVQKNDTGLSEHFSQRIRTFLSFSRRDQQVLLEKFFGYLEQYRYDDNIVRIDFELGINKRPVLSLNERHLKKFLLSNKNNPILEEIFSILDSPTNAKQKEILIRKLNMFLAAIFYTIPIYHEVFDFEMFLYELEHEVEELRECDRSIKLEAVYASSIGIDVKKYKELRHERRKLICGVLRKEWYVSDVESANIEKSKIAKAIKESESDFKELQKEIEAEEKIREGLSQKEVSQKNLEIAEKRLAMNSEIAKRKRVISEINQRYIEFQERRLRLINRKNRLEQIRDALTSEQLTQEEYEIGQEHDELSDVMLQVERDIVEENKLRKEIEILKENRFLKEQKTEKYV